MTGDRIQNEGQNTVTSNGALGSRPLLDTPFSITVIDAEDIAQRQPASMAQLFINDPSVFSWATAGTVNWWGTQIRGMGVRNYFIDDVPLLLYWGGDFPLEPIETVEALKGLTGFMYGFGSPGGVISYRTKRPTAETTVSAELLYRNPTVLRASVDAGGPVQGIDGFGYRVNLAREEGTAYNEAGIDRSLASLALEQKFSPDVRGYVTATYEKSKVAHEPFQVYWSDYQDKALPLAEFDYTKLNVENSFYETETAAAATGLDWDFAPGWLARVTLGYTRKLHHSAKTFIYMLDQPGDYAGYVYNFAELDENYFAQALVQGEFRTGEVRHEIVAGASYMKSISDFGNDYFFDNDFNGNIYQPQPFLITRPLSWNTQGYPFDERQRALFLSDTLHFGEQWQLLLGVRRTEYTLLSDDYSTTPVTPTVALIYKPAPYASIYGSFVEGMEPGSRVSGEYANAGDILEATISKQYEVGAKFEQDGLSLTTAAFRVDRANTIDQLIDGRRYLAQDGLTVYQGLEAIGSYAFTNSLRVGLGAIYLDATIRDVSPENAALAGNVPAEASKWQAVANAEYLVPGVPGLSLHGSVRYFGKAPTDDTNTLFIPGYTIAYAGFQYTTRIAGQAVEFTGNINNLFNKSYWGISNFGEARNASLSARLYW